MLPEHVNQMLENYREYAGRCKHLETEITETEKLLQKMRRTAIQDMAAPGAQNLDGMPHGTAISSPTERIAIMFAEGKSPRHIDELDSYLKSLRQEYAEKCPTVIFVDAWLSGLADRERWIIIQQVIDGVTWREIADQYNQIFGTTRSKSGLKKLRTRALEKIYRMAA